MESPPHASSGDEAAFSSHPLLHDEMATNTELHWSRRFAHGMLDWMLVVRLTARELAMLRVMDTVTGRPLWESSILDADLTETLRKELRAGKPLLSARAWAWCLDELRDKAAEFVRTGRVLVYDAGPRVSKSSVKGVEKLKNLVGDLAAQKDKGHGRHGEEVQLRNLVDPSLHPLVYGHTKILPPVSKVHIEHLWDRFGHGVVSVIAPHPLEEMIRLAESDPPGSLEDMLESDEWADQGYEWEESRTWRWSSCFQWLPCDVAFVGDEEDGGIRVRITSYINDLHPKAHRALYTVIEEVISASIEP